MTYTFGASQFMAQMRKVDLVASIHHRLLIEAGYTFDGFDGYIAPSNVTEQLGRDLWEQALKEAEEL
ncbi:MAG: hypothetical protein GOVbin4933_55 [Prokaryotic dsDNA virus sp.]|nr:MAG: hypothetical protein GOVbin4933_55 [Prokaryotic dsDNA virus sp.]|tara:strand:- start:1248 stop:1448 length:201 start_codon:yes stop_codon:yes gene_type:complete